MDTLNLDRRHLGLLFLVVSVFATWPSFAKKNRVIFFQKTLTIQTSKAEPPRVAFDEIHFEEKTSRTEWDTLKTKEGTRLLAGEESIQVASKKIVLKPMVFSRAEVRIQVPVELPAQVEDRAWVQNLSPAEKQRLEVAQEKHRILDEDWTLPTFRDLAAEKIAQAQKELQKTEQTSESKIVIQSHQADGSVKTPESIQTSDVQVKTGADGFKISGMLEIRGGLPWGASQWQIEIARYQNDVKKEDGRFDPKTNTFYVQAAEMSGTLVARLVDTKSGQTLGKGSLRVSQYAADQQRGLAKITIEKVNDNLLAGFNDFYKDPTTLASRTLVRGKAISTKVLLASLNHETRSDASGKFHFEQVKEGSWALLRTEAKGFRSGIHLVQAGVEKNRPLFPEAMISALQQIIRDQALSSEVAVTGSVVWGQITQNGKPLAGAEVDVEFLENHKPIYFNSLLLPDPQLKATGENGYFAILDLPAGFHSLVASFGKNYLSHANVVVDDDTISTAVLESTLHTEKAEVKVFDSFTGTPENARLEMQSLPVALNVQGFADVNLAPVSRLSFVRVMPENPRYSEALQIYDDASDSIHVPLVRKDWLSSLAAVKKISYQPDTGVVMGFVPSTEYEVYLGHDSQFPTDNIVYFNAAGEVVPTGVPGGGFVIFNVPPGTHSVVVAHAESDLLQTQVLPVDPLSLVVLKFR